MLLHTVDWWPAQPQVSDAGQEKRDRLGHLFPAATLEEAARTLIHAQEWSLCRQLYDHVLYQQIRARRLSTAGVLGLAVANGRLVQHLWPAAERGMLSAALGAVTEYAIGDRITRRELHTLKTEIGHLRDGWTATPGEQAGLAAMQAVVAVLRAAERAKSESDLARHGVRVLGWVESAAVQAVPAGRQWERGAAISGARAEIWRSAFLYLELATSGGRSRNMCSGIRPWCRVLFHWAAKSCYTGRKQKTVWTALERIGKIWQKGFRRQRESDSPGRRPS